MKENLKELLEMLEKNLDKQQDNLNEMRNQIIELKKELNPESLQSDIEVLDIANFNTLEEAENIFIKEMILEVNLSVRSHNALCRGRVVGGRNINTLRDLYELYYIYNNHIRNIGPESEQKIKRAISNLPILIEKVKKRRKNIEKYDQPLYLLIDRKIANEISKRYNVNTLNQLYKHYTDTKTKNNYINYCTDEKKVRELLRRY